MLGAFLKDEGSGFRGGASLEGRGRSGFHGAPLEDVGKGRKGRSLVERAAENSLEHFIYNHDQSNLCVVKIAFRTQGN